jgi:hypothetical protein
MSLTCRRHVGLTAKCWHFWPTRPCRADTKLIPTQHFRVGDGRHLPLSPLTRGTYIHKICQKPQHKTTNLSQAALPSTGFRPLSPWVGQRHHQIMVLPLPIDLHKARTVGLGGAAVGSLLFGAPTQAPSKKEEGGVLALGGHR